MPLTIEEVEHIANLARLELADEEKALFREQLSAILDYVARLQELDTQAIQPTSGGMTLTSGLRSDEINPSLSQAELFQNAPVVAQNQFLIPPVFE